MGSKSFALAAIIQNNFHSLCATSRDANGVNCYRLPSHACICMYMFISAVFIGSLESPPIVCKYFPQFVCFYVLMCICSFILGSNLFCSNILIKICETGGKSKAEYKQTLAVRLGRVKNRSGIPFHTAQNEGNFKRQC